MSNVLEALQGDFKVFLQALWSQLDLPEPTRAQYAIADYLQHGPKRLQIQAFRGVGKRVGDSFIELDRQLDNFSKSRPRYGEVPNLPNLK